MKISIRGKESIPGVSAYLSENIRDGFKFDPIEVEPDPDRPGKYRLLDGVHRWSAYKTVGIMEAEAIIKDLKGADPLLYAAKSHWPETID